MRPIQHNQPEPPLRDLLALETLPPMDMPATNNVPAVRPGPKREETLRKARLVEIASHIDEWLASPGLRTPR